MFGPTYRGVLVTHHPTDPILRRPLGIGSRGPSETLGLASSPASTRFRKDDSDAGGRIGTRPLGRTLRATRRDAVIARARADARRSERRLLMTQQMRRLC